MRTLSEAESRKVLEGYGIPLVESRTVRAAPDAVKAAEELGFPVVLKGAGDNLAHKTESGVVKAVDGMTYHIDEAENICINNSKCVKTVNIGSTTIPGIRVS